MRCAFISLSTPWVGLHCCFYDYFIFQFLALPLSPHKKINSKATTDRRAREPKMHFHELQKYEKRKYHEHAVMPLSRLWVGHKTIDRNIIFCQPNWNENFSGFFFFLFFKKKSLQIKSCINSLLSTARWWTIGILGDSRAMVRRIWIHVYETLRWMDSTRSISMYLKTS